MKVLPFKIPKPEDGALVYQEDHEIVFYDQLHQHEEIQISYIAAGSGSLIVGDSINYYKKNDILVIGENIPHVFRSDANASSKSIMYTLFFTRNSFGKGFFKINDLIELDTFFKNSIYGMKITSNQTKIIFQFERLRNINGIERIASLLIILNLILSSEKERLSSFVYNKKYTDAEGKRMNEVFQYVMDRFNEPISLDEIAATANMSKNAFCRYFKKRTNKTFFQFLIELRIENACKLLYKNKELSVALISELCGFQNIANFNRKFKALKNMTPSKYRLQFQKTDSV
ncbi:AraC family transcriptional regulator [Salinimicrobium marinum]|uniref:AraC family transcriptional regulator n=1 Tax=Salinimicrobium marinum TaxID=680283 RepID=A0A918W1Z1_9FLAO|nr:AraC family transcriptional regulator [Salinimicrobium marinum]GHA46689.1 AraC family transcriptional regulator [Salinimicrobium marinum]